MSVRTDREKEALIFARQDKLKALILDGWTRIQDGAAAYVKDGKYLDINGEKVSAPDNPKPASKVAKKTAA